MTDVEIELDCGFGDAKGTLINHVVKDGHKIPDDWIHVLSTHTPGIQGVHLYEEV